ncbi:hypothetical protein QTH87_05965 [Variovorax sp. J22P168]|uniref:hypothetical protein n=1 Tax=Variovorax jilinensis TaxID=3053513 RepID=UPI0025762BC4|nr:hypothetical protein [Variovorax sp. J22P168]MDM0011984.1 hypothetical protein [Variovorax sp. J22P168]
MSCGFASIEQRINRAVGGRLCNASARVGDGEPFGVIFERERADPLGLVEAAVPTISFARHLAPGLGLQSSIAVDGRPYLVVGGLEPDASGWLTLQLREA